MMNKLLFSTLFLASMAVNASNISVDMKDLDSGKMVGSILIEQNEYGVVFKPNLSGLPSGLHGFHIHENNSCDTSEKNGKTILGGAAGGHYDPMKTGQHGFPWSNDNHLGDLPPLYINMDGNAVQPVLAPRITLPNLSGRSLMIHAGSDNHSDHPKALGGGGARLVCGVIK
ncbi:superoxide dismutase family protein [Aliivibrio wodanis]|uniref:superoxide dismutase family protein n=1 Tax=Aliivibrio wodanis TaxID=80852 RepID=UPI00406CD8F0